MTNLYPTITRVNVSRGAPMGRHRWENEQVQGDLLLFRVPLDAGGYDIGHAYWGAPNNLWCATDSEDFRAFTRAESFADAAAKITALYPFACEFKALPISDLFAGYATTALWAETYGDEESDENSFLGNGYSLDSFTPEATAKMLADCQRFLDAAAPVIARIPGFDYRRAGDVLWYVSQGHGIGWSDDDCWNGLQGELKAITQNFRGEQHLYLTEDDKVGVE